jgi:hypothetical protein
MFFRLSICKSFICPSAYLSFCPSICLSVHLSIHLFVRPSVLSVHLSFCMSIRPSVCPSIHPSSCPSVHLSECLSVHPSINVSVHLSIPKIDILASFRGTQFLGQNFPTVKESMDYVLLGFQSNCIIFLSFYVICNNDKAHSWPY